MRIDWPHYYNSCFPTDSAPEALYDVNFITAFLIIIAHRKRQQIKSAWAVTEYQ